MQIKLIAHASVIVETTDCRIWSDPWLFGKAFNDSWSLAPPAAWDPADLDSINYLWISHEHPDHFHIPTLRSLPAKFKERVIVLFQQNNSPKMFAALSQLGFTNRLPLPHRTLVPIARSTALYCYEEGLMNSALLIRGDGAALLNINDAELRANDCRMIVQDVGDVDLVLNQFSVAGYNGDPDPEANVRREARTVLRNLVENHRDLHARATIPFASFMYFSSEDNRYMNAYANRPGDVLDYCSKRGVELILLYPGDTLAWPYVGDMNNNGALERYQTYYAHNTWSYDASTSVPLVELRTAFALHAQQIATRFPRVILACLKPVVIRIPDLDITIRSSLLQRTLEIVSDDVTPHIEVLSQPLSVVYRFPFGSQTLGVSARLRVINDAGARWRRHRMLYSLNNAELYLRPRLLLTWDNLAFLLRRLRGGVHQVRRRMSAM